MHRRRGEWVLESAGHRRPWKPFSPPLAHTPSSVPAASFFSRFRLPSSHLGPIPASLRSSVSLSVGRNNFHLLHLCCSRFPSPVPSLSRVVLSTMFSPFPLPSSPSLVPSIPLLPSPSTISTSHPAWTFPSSSSCPSSFFPAPVTASPSQLPSLTFTPLLSILQLPISSAPPSPFLQD